MPFKILLVIMALMFSLVVSGYFVLFCSTLLVQHDAVLKVATAGAPRADKIDLWKKIEEADGPQIYASFLAQCAGQDAFYASPNGLLIVADGVSSGKDRMMVARLSRFLVNNIAENWPQNMFHGQELLKLSLEALDPEMYSTSSTTIVVVELQDSLLNVTNLGDSGVSVFRLPETKPIFATKEMQHQRNIPFQLGGRASSKPEDAQVTTFGLQAGDIIVVGSDGLFDNIYDYEIGKLLDLMKSAELEEQVQVILQITLDLIKSPSQPPAIIIQTDQNKSENYSRKSPYTAKYNLKEDGHGKPDDISIVLAKVLG